MRETAIYVCLSLYPTSLWFLILVFGAEEMDRMGSRTLPPSAEASQDLSSTAGASTLPLPSSSSNQQQLTLHSFCLRIIILLLRGQGGNTQQS